MPLQMKKASGEAAGSSLLMPSMARNKLPEKYKNATPKIIKCIMNNPPTFVFVLTIMSP